MSSDVGSTLDLPLLSRSTDPAAGPAQPVRLVHLGLGAFHRAHQAWYTHRANCLGSGEGWGIAAFTGRSPTAAVRLAAQDGLYTLLTRAADGDRADIIASISRAHDGADTEAWCGYLADPQVGVVTLTVTEKGYRRAAGGGLDLADEQVAADLAALGADPSAAVVTAPVRLAQGLWARQRAGGGGLAVASCDNLSDNGAMTRRVVLDACAEIDPGLADWVGGSVSFVSTMIDRITPATTPEDAAEAAGLTGFRDESPVVTEPFSEWVLAGAFPAGRPDWAAVGAAIVDDVAPFEQRKLWLLNGGHSLLAYAGSIRGHETIAETMADATCRQWLEELWDDAVAYVPLPAEDLAAYRDSLRERFENPAIRHRLAQIASDGSQKIPLRVLPVIRLHRQAGHLPGGEVMALAAWLAHLRGHGAPVADAGAAPLVQVVTGPVRDAVRALLARIAPDLADDGALCDAVADGCRALEGGR